MSWALELLKDVVVWGLAFWFVPASYFLCTRKKELSRKSDQEGHEDVMQQGKGGHNAVSPPPKKELPPEQVLAKVARLRHFKV